MNKKFNFHNSYEDREVKRKKALDAEIVEPALIDSEKYHPWVAGQEYGPGHLHKNITEQELKDMGNIFNMEALMDSPTRFYSIARWKNNLSFEKAYELASKYREGTYESRVYAIGHIQGWTPLDQPIPVWKWDPKLEEKYKARDNEVARGDQVAFGGFNDGESPITIIKNVTSADEKFLKNRFDYVKVEKVRDGLFFIGHNESEVMVKPLGVKTSEELKNILTPAFTDIANKLRAGEDVPKVKGVEVDEFEDENGNWYIEMNYKGMPMVAQVKDNGENMGPTIYTNVISWLSDMQLDNGSDDHYQIVDIKNKKTIINGNAVFHDSKVGV